jgi:hypothetical protein
MTKAFRALTLVAIAAAADATWATPSTVVWAPSTTYTQPYLVPHITYDSYFSRTSDLATTTGLTIGVLPFDAVQAELGFDLFFPVDDPLMLNGKITLLEDKLFAYQPALSVGVANVGVTSATDFAMVYGVLGKTIPGLGATVAAGLGYGVNENLYVEPDGNDDQLMFLGSVTAPAIKIGKPFLDNIVLAADVQTGRNGFSAWGAAASFYFTPTVGLLTGPVFFLEPDSVGGTDWLWTLQLDVDLPGIADMLKGK